MRTDAAPKIFPINRNLTDDAIETTTPTVIDTDKYIITKLITRRNWGAIYDAKNSITNERCAIKVFDPNETQIYTGQLNYELIAADMLQRH